MVSALGRLAQFALHSHFYFFHLSDLKHHWILAYSSADHPPDCGSFALHTRTGA